MSSKSPANAEHAVHAVHTDIEGIDYVYEKALEKQEKDRAEEEEWAKMLQAEDEKEAKYREWKSEQHEETLRLSKAIFKWARRFIESPRSGTIFKAAEGPVRIYTGQYLHCRPGEWGSYAMLDLRQDGTFRYRESYKWMGYAAGEHYQFKTAREMAETLNPGYVQEVWRSIEDNSVRKAMARNL